jgi:uncharacterized protein YjiS (DUF1127 family)
MAYTASFSNTAKSFSVRGILSAVFTPIGNFFVNLAEAQSRSAAVEELQSMSDRQLADMGIKREDIVRRVFADMMHI